MNQITMKNNLDPALRKIEAEEDFESCLAGLGGASELISKLIVIRKFKKGDHLLKAGGYGNSSYSIISGCVRQYYLMDGEEKTTFFYTEGQSIFCSLNGTQNTKSRHYLSCVEDSTLTVLTREAEAKLFAHIPKLQEMSRQSLKEELAIYQEMLATYITTTPEERYANLMNDRPDLLNRVPQYQLASYLGVKPESLSRIRKRILNKA